MSSTNATAVNRYWFLSYSNSGWDACRSATNSYQNNSNTSPQCLVRHDDSGSTYTIVRTPITFDSSGVPANATISSAVLHIYLQSAANQQNADPDTYICPLSETGAGTQYFNQAYFGSYVGKIANPRVYDNSAATYNEWKTASLATSCITKNGTTLLGLRMGHDYLNYTPGNTNAKENAMTYIFSPGYYPYITITWTTPPAVTTGTASALQPISATLAGNVTDAGGGTVSERGVCWSTSENPTTANSKATSAGTTGTYTVSATGLLPGTLYYARAYVTTENSTTYGDNVTFRTPGGAILFNLL